MARILIVDDDDISRMLLGETLKSDGYEILQAADADAALKTCKTIQVDLIIADILMPGKSGLELVMEVQTTHPNIKVILLSGGITKTAKPGASLGDAFGVYATIAKPFEVDELLEKVKGALA